MSNTITLDLSALSDEQLNALTAIYPTEVKDELARRSSYNSISEALTALAQAGADLEVVFGQIRNTSAAAAVSESNILKVISRFIGYARVNGVAFHEPVVKQIVVEKAVRGPRKPKTEGEAAPAPASEAEVVAEPAVELAPAPEAEVVAKSTHKGKTH